MEPEWCDIMSDPKFQQWSESLSSEEPLTRVEAKILIRFQLKQLQHVYENDKKHPSRLLLLGHQSKSGGWRCCTGTGIEGKLQLPKVMSQRAELMNDRLF